VASLNGIPIFDESNYETLIQQTIPAGGQFGSGFDPNAVGAYGSACPGVEYANIPRSEWKDRIEEKERKGLFPGSWFERGKVKILNQQSWGYCWMYGVVGAMQLRYAMTGQQAPHLNPFYPAWLGKNGANQGGWGGEALGYLERFGAPVDSVFPGQPTSRAAFDRHEVKENAKLHKVWKFKELPRNSFQALMNMWLSDNPLPVSQAYNWWGHLVYGVKPVVTGANAFGTLIANSWDYGWGQQGLGIIAESRASAAEQICVDLVSTVAT
jgi:hypothetical protein